MNFIRDDGIKMAFFTIYESDIGYTIAKHDWRTSSELLNCAARIRCLTV